MVKKVRWLRCSVIGDGTESNPWRPAITPVYRKEAIDSKTGEKRFECVEAYEHEGYSVVYFPANPPYTFCIVRIKCGDKIKFKAEHIIEEFIGEEKFKKLCDKHSQLKRRWKDQPAYPNTAPDPVETRYMRYDGHTVNGLEAGQLKTTQTTEQDFDYYRHDDPHEWFSCTWGWDVIKRTSGGSESVIGSKVAQVSRSTQGEGLQSNTWTCPQTDLVSSDAIRLSAFVKVPDTWRSIGYGVNDAWITEQLGASQLNSATWRIYSYTRCYQGWATPEMLRTIGYLYWGNSAHNTRITNFSWTISIVPPTVTTQDATNIGFD